VATKNPGLRAWRSQPKSVRRAKVKAGINTREGKIISGGSLRKKRKAQGLNPNTGAPMGGTRGGSNSVGAAAEAAPKEPTGSQGIAPRGINAERVRKTTTRGGKVGVVKSGMTSGPVGVEQYRNIQGGPSAAAGAAVVKDTSGGSAKGASGKSKGRAKGRIKKPNKGGPAKKFIAKSGGGRAALNAYRTQLTPGQQKASLAVGKAGGNMAKAVRQTVRTTRPTTVRRRRRIIR
jgi:hypothetical protein